uniref:cytochrome c oxidase subunit II n=1 Tax=Pseudodiaptomus hessei TaxID=2919416 RepID=UPI002A7EB8A2|nr:cytochrome c oxidase subunit II [Pseudodiaptomus hessei]WOH21597.1 cytochrome c oxidase subunit 2 [Pseudodiaptomus hessei]
MATWAQFGLNDANSPIMEELVFLHDFVNMILLFIITFVFIIMVSMILNNYVNKNLLEMQLLESIWTLIPAIILVQIALPSLLLLYMLDESADTSLTIKTVGHQWYWSYEYSDFWSLKMKSNCEFDAYMIPSDSAEDNMFRLLDVDNRTVVPLNMHIRMLITAADVLHSWALPSFGVKADAVPGRLNQVKFMAQRPGLFYGQCSEICGANHSFMPIVVEVVSPKSFINWLISSQD